MTEHHPDLPAEIATAPPPVLTLDGHTAVIGDVRFIWRDHCSYCRRQFTMATNGGRITAGIAVDGRRGPHWYQRWQPAAAPEPPPHCPNPRCRRPAPFAANPRSHIARHVDTETMTYRYGDPSPVYSSHQLLRQVWDVIRATYPELAAQADIADRRRLGIR
ncbi:hypothetical protein EV384_4602 [Micromonospora kangleipakensis]|uniref:Uncharacterized protein n=1 Tax=Micromonospora kangleipakensis TaxID=1077942 RepID=A0A4Q8BDN3_9ACTN|nr:hypothetical protein [Micromonospora kangleipakensis]RZU76007.1 hypothetical protein EV384_4602 [Micromonospora kangleipakensis]